MPAACQGCWPSSRAKRSGPRPAAGAQALRRPPRASAAPHAPERPCGLLGLRHARRAAEGGSDRAGAVVGRATAGWRWLARDPAGRAAGWGRSTVLDQLPEIIRTDAPILEVRINGRSLPDGPGLQAAALRDSLLGAGVRRQAAALLCTSRLRGAPRLGAGSLLLAGIAGTISLLQAGLAAAAAGGVADDRPASENGAAARAARVVAAVSASSPAWSSLTTLTTWNQAWPSP